MKPNILLTLIMINISGNPTAYFYSKELTLVFVSLVLTIICIVKKQQLLKSALFPPLVFAIIFAFHAMNYSDFNPIASLGFMILLYIGMLHHLLVKDFLRSYLKCMVGITVLSFVFYFPSQIFNLIGFEFKELFSIFRADLGKFMYHIHLHNFRIANNFGAEDQQWRNAGLFWEPGAFSGYLCLSLAFLGLSKDRYTKRQFKIYASILIIGLLTTFSTSGYVLLPFIAYFFFIKERIDKIKNKFVIYIPTGLLFAFVMLPIFTQFSFLSSKITTEYDQALVGTENGYHGMSRLGGFVFDYEFIEQRPLIGWGADSTIRTNYSSFDEEVFKRQGNGLTGFIVKFGVIGTAFYFLVLFRRGKGMFGDKTLYFCVLIVLILINEQYLNYPLLLSLMFLRNHDEKNNLIRTRDSKLASVHN